MANKQGTNQIVDSYIGDKLIEARYIGQTKYFDPYTEVTGTFPLSFNSRVAGALKNYRLYGDSDGAGVQTENLFSGKGKTRNIGAASVKQFVESNIQVSPGETYCINASSALCPRLGFYKNSTRVSASIWVTAQSSITIPNDCNNMYVEVRNYNYDAVTDEQLATVTEIMLTSGSTAPTTYIPYGYKIPISLTDGTSTSNYDLFIGDTKLGAEEYVDYGEQKVYKRTENLVDISMFTNGYTLATGTGLPVISPNRIATTSPIDVSNVSSVVIQISNKESETLSSIMYSVFNGNTLIRRVTGVAQNAVIDVSSATSMYLSLYDTEKVTTDDFNYVMLVKGSTAPTSYIPYLQPTDPPAPLPAFQTYQGENTLSSTETVGEVTVKGRISASNSTP